MGFNVLLLPFVGHDLYMGVSVNGGDFYPASASISEIMNMAKKVASLHRRYL